MPPHRIGGAAACWLVEPHSHTIDAGGLARGQILLARLDEHAHRHGAATSRGAGPEHWYPAKHVVAVVEHRTPAVGVIEDAIENGVGPTPDQHRWVGGLHRAGFLAARVEVDEGTVVLGTPAGPQRANRGLLVEHERHSVARIDAVVSHLLAVPTGADAELGPATGYYVEAGDLLGRGEDISLVQKGDADPQS
jgi:hypothetical protein